MQAHLHRGAVQVRHAGAQLHDGQRVDAVALCAAQQGLQVVQDRQLPITGLLRTVVRWAQHITQHDDTCALCAWD
jgi:hypothetical protein